MEGPLFQLTGNYLSLVLVGLFSFHVLNHILLLLRTSAENLNISFLSFNVVGNEKGGGSGGWLLFAEGFRPWQSMSVNCLRLLPSFLQCISVSSM